MKTQHFNYTRFPVLKVFDTFLKVLGRLEIFLLYASGQNYARAWTAMPKESHKRVEMRVAEFLAAHGEVHE